LKAPDKCVIQEIMDPNRSGEVQKRLLRWFGQKGRDLPWRKTRDPYAIWISEVMLQQTQVATVIPYYQRFLKSFPTVHHLAKSDLSRVLKIWEGLGYYSRARNLHRASKIILNHFKGKIPDHQTDLLNLPGIGKYTAGAILSIAYNKEAPILDGNVKRVLSRLFAVSGDPKKTEELLWKISESLIPKGQPNAFNQALMDLGSMICNPKNPLCHHCPLHRYCKAKASGNPARYPFREVKKRIPHIEAISGLILRNGKVLLNQRPPKGLLGGLWEFPNWKIEEKGRSRLRLRLRNHMRKEIGIDVGVKEPLGTFKQTFTHFKLTLHVFKCEPIAGRAKGKWVAIEDLDQLAMPRIDRRIAEVIDGEIARSRDREKKKI
jgi:A/G-specific adenine glycosylase